MICSTSATAHNKSVPQALVPRPRVTRSRVIPGPLSRVRERPSAPVCQALAVEAFAERVRVLRLGKAEHHEGAVIAVEGIRQRRGG